MQVILTKQIRSWRTWIILWQPYHNMVLTERNSSSFNTKARRREAVGSSTIPIRVDEFDAKDTKTIAEFEEDLRDNYNSVYASIQQNNGDTRRTMLRALPYVTTNDRMQFQKPAFAKRAIIYETTGSIPKEAMEHYSKTKDTIDFTNWPKIGALATSLVIDKKINLKQPWNEFALELIEKIYKKCGIPLPGTWQIPTAFTQKNSQNLIDRNVEEILLHIMKRAIINKLPGTYDEKRITTDIAVLAKTLKTNWLFLADNGFEDTIVIKPRMFETAREDHDRASIPRGKTREILVKHGGIHKEGGVKIIGEKKSQAQL